MSKGCRVNTWSEPGCAKIFHIQVLRYSGIAPFFQQWNHQTLCVPSCHDEICCCGSLSSLQYGGPFGRRIFRLRTLGLCKTFVPWNCRLGAQLVVLVLSNNNHGEVSFFKVPGPLGLVSQFSLSNHTFLREGQQLPACCFNNADYSDQGILSGFRSYQEHSLVPPDNQIVISCNVTVSSTSILHLWAPQWGWTYILHLWTDAVHRNDPNQPFHQPFPKQSLLSLALWRPSSISLVMRSWNGLTEALNAMIWTGL